LRFAQTLIHLIQNHGFLGLVAFVKIKTGFTENVQLKSLKHNIVLRPNSSDVTTFKNIFAHGDYNFDLESEPKIIIDAGANIGLSAIYFTNKYATAKIIAVELSATNFQLLIKNTNRYKNIVAINAGLWHKHQVLKFKEEGFSPWGYKINNELEGEGESISVDSITVNEIIEKYHINTIDLLKVDIEGAEADLFSGNYESWLPKVKCLVIEFHDRSRPKSSQTVRTALNKFDFTELEGVGENAVFVNNKLK